MRSVSRLAVIIACLTLSAGRVWAAWPSDPLPNVAVDTLSVYCGPPQVVTDGSGGVIAVWMASRGNAARVMAQRFNAAGQPLWAPAGLIVPSQRVEGVRAVADGQGGVIAVWEAYAADWTKDLYAQRLSGSGALLWGQEPVAFCTAAQVQSRPTLATDGAGGAIVVWSDTRTVTNWAEAYDQPLYAQRIDASGAPQWATNGIQITPDPGLYFCEGIIEDGAGGAIIPWSGPKGIQYSLNDIRAQRISSSGAFQWGSHGVAVCVAPGSQNSPQVVSDGNGGAILAWLDWRSYPTTYDSYDLYMQRLDASGSSLWTADGVSVCAQPGNQQVNALLGDGAGGAIVTWNDSRNGTFRAYAQRVTAFGASVWTSDGVELFGVNAQQAGLKVVADGSGGVFVTCVDSRHGSGQVYGQRLASNGTRAWGIDGLQISAATGGQFQPMLAPSGSYGAVVVWQDERGGMLNTPGNRSWLFAQGLHAGGLGGGESAAVETPRHAAGTLALASSNPSRHEATRVRFTLSAGERASLEVVDLTGHRVESHSLADLGDGPHELGILSGDVAPGVYFIRLRRGGRVETTRIVRID